MNYQTVAEWLAEVVDGNRYGDVLPQDREEMMRTGDVWVVHWYPDTPVGFHAVAAATLDRAIELANDG